MTAPTLASPTVEADPQDWCLVSTTGTVHGWSRTVGAGPLDLHGREWTRCAVPLTEPGVIHVEDAPVGARCPACWGRR
jgi:hypothetical protein